MTASAPFPPPSDRDALEKGTEFTPRFNDQGLIPAVASDAATGEVLMMAWMNAESLRRTIDTGEAWYWSRSRSELWHKGATSGHIQTVKEIRTDCDQDTLWLIVEQKGSACHTGKGSCFYRKLGERGGLEPIG